MWKLLLKKLGMSVITVLVFFVGAFGYGLVIAPFNLPYLLKLPEDANVAFGGVFALLVVCVVTVIVRTDWCYENDAFFASNEEKQRPLIWRIVTSREFIADVIVCALCVLVYSVSIGARSQAVWWWFAMATLILVGGYTLLFAVLDCLLYMIARKRADRRLER